jgi:hypothetical protein
MVQAKEGTQRQAPVGCNRPLVTRERAAQCGQLRARFEAYRALQSPRLYSGPHGLGQDQQMGKSPHSTFALG